MPWHYGDSPLGRNAVTALPLAPPAGMRDLLHPESAARRALGRRLGEVFALHGYELVTTPPFEHAEVLERGLETVDRRDLVRFVEPETGEVALLRPDITPQIARIVATRLSDRPPPWRLCYEGTVIRRRRGRARRHRQIAQTGVEHVGLAGADADAEVISVAARACDAVGLDGYRIELGQARIGRAALERVPEIARDDAAAALACKDAAELEGVLRAGDVPSRERELLLALTDLYGDVEVLTKARRLVRGDEMVAALEQITEVAARLESLGLGPRLAVDLGELRGMSYYTGVSFTVLAEGPGEPVGAGGRYDNLLGRFGAPAPATGFALDLDNLEWALSHAGAAWAPSLPIRVALAGDDEDRCASVAETLRRQSVAVARLYGHDARQALAFARAWGYDAALFVGRAGVRAQRVADGASRELEPGTPAEVDALSKWARGS